MDEHRSRAIVALPGWWSSIAEAEAQAAPLLATLDVRTACTHVADGIALVTVDAAGADPQPVRSQTARWASLAQDAVADHQACFGGRLFVFPGQRDLGGTLTAAEVLERTVIDELVVPGHPTGIDPQTSIEGLDHVRPVYRQGQVVLTLRPVRPGVFQPFERRRPAGVLRPLG